MSEIASTDYDRRRRDVVVVALAFVSGAVDSFGFLALGGVFTSVMTGNMVLLGLSAGSSDHALEIHSGIAILCYIGGCALGTQLSGKPKDSEGPWPIGATRALSCEWLGLALVSVVWLLTSGGGVGGGVVIAVLAINAVSLGMQSSATVRLGVSGLSTTYMTGTLTSAVVELTRGHGWSGIRQPLSILCGLVAGAATSGLLTAHTDGLAPFLALAALTLALLAIGPGRHRRPTVGRVVVVEKPTEPAEASA